MGLWATGSAAASGRVELSDLTIRPERWDTRWRLDLTDRLLRDPFARVPWVERVFAVLRSTPQTSGGLLRLASDPLSIPGPEPRARSASGIPAILSAIHSAEEALKPLAAGAPRPLDSLHRTAAALFDPSGQAGDLELFFDRTEPLDIGPAVQSAMRLQDVVDQFISAQGAGLLTRSNRPGFHMLRGDRVIVRGKDLAYPLVIIQARESVYEAAPAAAGPGQVRVVIDFSETVTLRSSGAASGFLGIGLWYVPNPAGFKTLLTGDLSLGVGTLGVGGLLLRGRSRIESGIGSLGAGLAGVGWVLHEAGSSSTYRTRASGQGTGFPRGVGVFVFRGNDAEIQGGLDIPDPREERAAISFCQGAGYGPRAFAAGGVGLAMIQGDRNRVTASYFAQGAGYWHGLGGFFVEGQSNRIQARRYAQGSGIHTAIGVFRLQGDRHEVLNWGVGPAYGWDYGIGTFISRGNDTVAQTEWGVGHGEVNGHSWVDVEGERNQLAWPGVGTGAINRLAPGWGIARISGSGTRVMAGPASIWGHRVLERNAVAVSSLPLVPATWPLVPGRQAAAQAQAERLQSRLREAASLPAPQRAAALLEVAADFSLDPAVPSAAQQQMLSAPGISTADWLARVEPQRFDEFLRLRVILASRFWDQASTLEAEIRRSSGTRTAQLMGLAFYLPAEEAEKIAAPRLSCPDWRIRRAAITLLGQVFSRDPSWPTGREIFLAGLQETVLSGKTSRRHERRVFERQRGDKGIQDLLAILSMRPETREPAAAVAAAQSDWFSPMTEAAFHTFWQTASRHARALRPAIEAERASLASRRPHWRDTIFRALEDPDEEVRQAAILALGLRQDPDAAVRVAPFLEDPRALLREAAATALGKLGPHGREAIAQALRSPNPRTRQLSCVAAAQSWDPVVIRLLRAGLDDPEPSVRRTAQQAIPQISPLIERERIRLQREAQRSEKD